MRITDEHTEHWLKHGYTVVEGFLEGGDLEAAQRNMYALVPTLAEAEAGDARVREGSGFVAHSFPFGGGQELNAVATHPELEAFAQRHIDGDVVLGFSGLRAKYSGYQDFDRAHHLDFQNNTLAYPRDEGPWRYVTMILYLEDVTEALGPTCVISQEHTRHLPLWPNWFSREQQPHLYDLEVPVTGPAGTLLIYSLKTYHRGSAFRTAHGARYTLPIIYRSRQSATWQGLTTWTHQGTSPEMVQFMAESTPRQRTLAGLPAVGDPFWNDETIAGVAARYPGIDMSPYQA